MSYELIETVTVGAGGAISIEFTSIPQDGTDLVLVMSLRGDESGVDNNLKFQFNLDTGSNYSRVSLNGTGGTVGTSKNLGITYIPMICNGDSATASTFSSTSMIVSNYTSTTSKSTSTETVVENNGTTGPQRITAGLYSTSSSITSFKISFETGTGNFVQHSTASLYKITAS